MRSVGSSKAKSVKLAGMNPLQPEVPDVARLVPCGVEQDAPCRHRILAMIKEIEANTGSVPAENREVHSSAPRTRPKRQGHTRTDGLDFTETQQSLQLVELLSPRSP